MYHTSALAESVKNWPSYANALVEQVEDTISALIRDDALHAIPPASRPLSAQGQLGTEISGSYGKVATELNTLLSRLDLKMQEELIKLPDFFLLFDVQPGFSPCFLEPLRAALAIEQARELFLEANHPVFHSDSCTPKLVKLAPMHFVKFWASSLDPSLALDLWHLIEEEEIRYETFGEINLADVHRHDRPLPIKGWHFKDKTLQVLLQMKGMPQETIDELSFLEPWPALSLEDQVAYSDARPGVFSPPPGLFSAKALARHYAESNPGLFKEIQERRGIDPNVIDTLLPSWKGDAESLFEAALSLSAEPSNL